MLPVFYFITMAKKEKKSLNNLIIGIISGLILPIISIYFFYLFQGSFNGPFEEYIKQVLEYKAITQILSVCMLANLGLFFIFLQTIRYKSARGVLFATIIYAIAMVLYMFVL